MSRRASGSDSCLEPSAMIGEERRVSALQAGIGVESCVEHGIWTPVTQPPPRSLNDFTLKLKHVDPAENDRLRHAGLMTFHMIGCTGDYTDHQPQEQLAAAMAEQADSPGSVGASNSPAAAASFMFHLGDVVYKDENSADPDRDDQNQLYNAQFYAPYTGYGRRIFAIAGNHDGKVSPHARKSELLHFFTNHCAASARKSSDNITDQRAAMTQPYVYWRLNTPLAYIIGLYSNIANGGLLDDPFHRRRNSQYRWLVAQLQDVRGRNAHNTPRKAVLLAVHYPPYSGTTNFAQRGDPTLGPTNATEARPLGEVLQWAFTESGLRPDAVFSAHAHLYQRLTYRYDDGWEVPYLVAGSGGHAPVESMWKGCDGTAGQAKEAPFEAVLPSQFILPPGDRVQVIAHNDQDFGFLRVTVAANRLTGEFFTKGASPLALADSFSLDLGTHLVTEAGR
jgi:acid phosphatase type 7